MKKILFTTHILEHPPAGGQFLRIENSIKALNKICELHVISRVTKNLMGGKVAECFFERNSYNFRYASSAKEHFLISKIVRKIKRVFVKDKSDIELDANFIVRYACKNKINIIWFGFGNISLDLMKNVKRLDPNLKIICDTDSVWSRYILRELPYEDDPVRKKEIEESGRKKEKEERAWVDLCDITTAVSELDADYYRSIALDRQKIKVFSNVIDLNNYSNSENNVFNIKKPCIYLSGSFAPKSPMDKASRWFIKNVFYLIKNEMPDIHLYIVGNDSDKVLFDINDSSIEVVGKVKSVLPYLTNADVSIVPLMFESGTRFKILEAAACNIPIVSTVLGAEGLNVSHGEDIFIADEPELFASYIIKLIKDKKVAFSMASKCREMVMQKYSLEKLVLEGSEILKSL